MQAVGKGIFMLKLTPSGVGMLSTLLVLPECEETRSECVLLVKAVIAKFSHLRILCSCIGPTVLNRST